MKSRRHLEHHVILIQLREHGGHLALAICVVKRIVDHRRRDAEPRGRVAIEHQLYAKPFVWRSLATSRNCGIASRRSTMRGTYVFSSSTLGSSIVNWN